MSRNEASVESHIVSMARGSFALSYGYGRANELAVAKQIPPSYRTSSNAR